MAVSDATFLDNIDTALNSIITGEYESLSSMQRQLTKLGIDKLMELKKQFEDRIAGSAAAEQGGGNVLVRLGQEQ
jgi:hypothetical protein